MLPQQRAPPGCKAPGPLTQVDCRAAAHASLCLQDARLARDNAAIKRAITAYDDALEAALPRER